MFRVLIESGAQPERRRLGGLVSTALHVVLIAGGVAGTTHARAVEPPDPKADIVKVRIVTKAAPATARPVPRAAASPTSTITIARIKPLVAPSIVPVSIPNVDLSANVPTEIGVRTSSGSPIGVLGREGDPGGDGGGSGNSIWSASDLAMHMIGKPTPPRYPESLRRGGIAGRVLIRFIVDTTGRIDLSSVEIVESTHELFVSAVRSTLPTLRFQAAQVHGKGVRALALMPFVFELAR